MAKEYHNLKQVFKEMENLPFDEHKKITKRIGKLNNIIIKNDPALLDKFIAAETYAPLREFAEYEKTKIPEKRKRTEEHQKEVEASEKCPKCGKPLVDVEYYSCTRGQSKVTKEIDWAANKKTTTVSTAYTGFHPHTARFCPSCAGRKMSGKYIAGIVMTILGILLVPAGIYLTDEKLLGNRAILIIALGALLTVVGFKTFTGLNNTIHSGKGSYTNSTLKESENLHDLVSELYIKTTPFSQIPRTEGDDSVVERGLVRNPRLYS